MHIWQRLILPTNDRPTLSSERAPQKDKESNSHHIRLNSVHESQKGLDPKTDWLADSRNVTLRGSLIALMMKAVLTSETSVNINLTTRRYTPEDSKLNINFSEM
jgi:hypothetical protein